MIFAPSEFCDSSRCKDFCPISSQSRLLKGVISGDPRILESHAGGRGSGMPPLFVSGSFFSTARGEPWNSYFDAWLLRGFYSPSALSKKKRCLSRRRVRTSLRKPICVHVCEVVLQRSKSCMSRPDMRSVCKSSSLAHRGCERPRHRLVAERFVFARPAIRPSVSSTLTDSVLSSRLKPADPPSLPPL